MSENDIPSISRPSISDATIQSYREMLTPQFKADHPQYAEMVERTLSDALKGSGQDKPPPADPRSDAQQLHDHRYSVSVGVLPPYLATLLEQGEADQGKAAIESTGRNYTEVLASARVALNHAKSQADPTRLSAGALVALAAYSDYLGRWAAGRPKKD
jgi:hypothetical protein